MDWMVMFAYFGALPGPILTIQTIHTKTKITFVIEDWSERIIEIKYYECLWVLALTVELRHCLLQQSVVESRKGVYSFIALLEGIRNGEFGEASEGLDCCNSNFSHSHVVYSFQVHSNLVDYTSNEGWKTLQKLNSLVQQQPKHRFSIKSVS